MKYKTNGGRRKEVRRNRRAMCPKGARKVVSCAGGIFHSVKDARMQKRFGADVKKTKIV